MKTFFKISYFCISVMGVVLAALSAGDEPRVSAEAADDGFISIFDGDSLDGWKGDPVYWRVEDGKLVGEVTSETLLKRNSFIIWQGGRPADFELKLQFRISESGNSGVNYRSEVIEGQQYALRGYQADIDGKNRYNGQNYEEKGRTTLAYQGQKTVIPAIGPQEDLRAFVKRNAWTKAVVIEKLESAAEAFEPGSWNDYHIIAEGNRLRHYLNGVLMSEVIDQDSAHAATEGYLGVQVHTGPPMKVEFRSIRLKTISGNSLD